jgi:hypothetical protein
MMASFRSIASARANGSKRCRSCCNAATVARSAPWDAARRSRGVLRRVVPPREPGAVADLADEFHGRRKEIHHEPELVAVEIVDRIPRLEGVVPLPPQELADMGPVALLDMGIVVFLVGAAAGELDRAGFAVPVEVGIDELGAIVRIDPAQREGQGLAEVLQGRPDDGLALPHDGPTLAPAGMDVGEIEGLHKLAVGGVAGVGDQVDFGKARDRDIPVVRLEGDVVLEERPGLRAAVEPALQPPFAALEAAIDGAGADGTERLLDAGRKREVLRGPRPPQGQQRLQPRRPRIARGLPDRGEGRDGLGSIGRRPPAVLPLLRPVRSGQEGDGVLAVVARRGAELVQAVHLGGTRYLSVALAHSISVFAARGAGHRALRRRGIGQTMVRFSMS